MRAARSCLIICVMVAIKEIFPINNIPVDPKE
jgi:hypothetical protein